MKFFYFLLFLISSIPVFSEKVSYLGEEYHSSEYLEIKKSELKKFKTDLKKLKCKRKFLFLQNKYFLFAYSKNSPNIQNIINHVELFYDQIYPQYFESDPNFSFRVVIFQNPKEMQKCTNTPPGLLGFYSPYGEETLSNTLFSYSGSGIGTYWHEIMHGFIDSNLDDLAPDWFNEGLSSLYEGSFLEENKIGTGFVNWRHPILKKSVKAKKFISLSKLFSRSEEKNPLALSEARFLFLYLQSKKHLIPFSKSLLKDIIPKYKDKELADQTILLLEKLLAKPIDEIESEIQELILKSKKGDKL